MSVMAAAKDTNSHGVADGGSSAALPPHLQRSTERPGSMPLLVEAEGAPAHNCQRMVLLGSAKVGKTALVNRFLNNRYDDKYTPTIEDFHRKVYRIRGEAYRLDILDTSGNNPFPAMKRLSLLTGDLFVLVYSIDSRESFDEVQRLVVEVLEAKGHRGTTISPLSVGGGGASGSVPSSPASSTGSGLGGGSLTPRGSRFGKCGLGGGGQSDTSPVVVRSTSRSKRSPPIVIVGNKCDREAHRVVSTAELRRLGDSLPQCVSVEASARKNLNVEEIFVQLFVLARLPTEMSPSLHRRVPLNYVGGFRGGKKEAAGKDGRGGSGGGGGIARCGSLLLRRRLSDACGAVAPNVRRPSIRTDLLLLQTKGKGGVGGGGGGGCGGSSGVGFGLLTSAAGTGSDSNVDLLRRDGGRCLVQ